MGLYNDRNGTICIRQICLVVFSASREITGRREYFIFATL